MPDASPEQALRSPADLLFPGSLAAPAPIEAQVREPRVWEPPALAEANSAVHEEAERPPAVWAPPVRDSYRCLELESCRPHPQASVAPARPLKAWEAHRCPAKAPGPARQLALQVVSRLLPEPPANGRAPPNIPPRSTARTKAVGRRQSPPARPWSASPRYRAGAPPVPRPPALLYQSIRAYLRISRPSTLDFPAILLLSSMPLDGARKSQKLKANRCTSMACPQPSGWRQSCSTAT